MYMTGETELTMELFQQTMLMVWRYLDTYRFDLPFSTWIFSIASNAAKKHYIINKHMINKINFDEKTSDIIIHEWEKNLDDKIVIQSMINSIRDPYRTALKLRFMEELDYKEIASIMKTNPNQIKTYLFRAKKTILKSWIKSQK